ncbi:MAG: hypothetical protein NTX81_02115 [Candidatus Bathyarchaeota archaeon]|jgi:hypothetical protein|nr:hypothetical protein [Candidatus Bathyarchaeota archaeon]
MSVNWAILSSAEETAKAVPGAGVASITAGLCYRENQDIEYTPTNNNSAHCDVVGQKTKAVKRHLRDAAILLLPPGQPTSPNP